MPNIEEIIIDQKEVQEFKIVNINTFEVKEIHLPYIEYKYRALLNLMTDNGVTKLFNTFLFQGNL